jgi:hypothetical protein
VVSMLAAGTRPKPSDFFGRKIPQHAFLRKGSKAVCPISQICGMLKNPVITWKLGHRQKFAGHFSSDSSTFRYRERSHFWGRGGIWRREWGRLKAGESNGKLPLRTCLECNEPEPYRSPDWALVPAKPAQGLNSNIYIIFPALINGREV